ncbi:MAG: hypothetical protein ACRDNF_16140 [Streptosporangiaceae bacterium]
MPVYTQVCFFSGCAGPAGRPRSFDTGLAWVSRAAARGLASPGNPLTYYLNLRRSLIVAVVSGGATTNGGSVAVDQVSAATGRRTRQLFRMKTGNGFSYQYVSADPSGRYVLFDAGTTRTDVNGWIDHGKLVRLRPAGNGVDYAAWSGR